MAEAGELAYLRTQLRLAARLTARLVATNDQREMVALIVEELHSTFAFYLAAIQRLDNCTSRVIAVIVAESRSIFTDCRGTVLLRA